MKINQSSLPSNEKLKMPLDCEEYFRERHFLRTSLKCQLITGVCMSFFLVISVFVLTMFTVARVRHLEEEVETLRYAIDSVKNLEQDLINTIVGFENGDLYPDDDTDSDPDPETIVDPEVILDSENSEVPSNDENDDYDYDTELFQDNDDNETSAINSSYVENQYESPLNLTKDFKDGFGVVIRKRRNVVGTTPDGVPINSEPYAERKRTDTAWRIQLNGVSVTAEPARPSVYGSPLPVYSERYTAYPDSNEAPSTVTPPPVFFRSSRHMINNPSKTSRPIYKRPTLKSGDTENEPEEDGSSSEFTIVKPRYRQRNSNLEILEGNHPRVGRIKPLPAVHYSGDTSKYILGQHENFFGNGHLRHPQQTFMDWKPRQWVESLNMDSYYSMKNGVVTIGESGLYYIYAQIYYLDEHDLLGYWVQKNGEMILQCTISLHSPSRKIKGNTCFTAGVEYLAEGDTVSIADITTGKYSLFETGKSFFGLIKIGDARIR